MGTQCWIWRNFRLDVPGDWELLQFSRNAELGRCAFADRDRFRLELSWRAVPGAPDYDRMMSDYAARLEENGEAGIRRIRQGDWHGMVSGAGEAVTSRYGRFFPAESCLVELVFPGIGAEAGTLDGGILDRVAEERPHDGPTRRWRAFGLDLRASADLAFVQCDVRPAHVEWAFADRRRRREERFSRRGMVKEWMKGTVADWLPVWVRRETEAEVTSRSDREVRGHHVACAAGMRRRGGLLGRRSECTAEAWICPADGRVYGACRISPVTGTGTSDMLAGARVSCCDAMGLKR